MVQYATENIRTVALVGHGAAGKTTVAEALLARAKAIPAMGSVERGTTVGDFDPLEKAWQHSLRASVLHLDTDSIEEYFVQKMNERLPPTRVTKIINTIKRERGGTLRHLTYKDRSVGRTEQWEMTQKLFNFHIRRLEFKQHEKPSEAVAQPAPLQPRLF